MSEMTDLNPQATQMAAESMVRTLAAQASAIWPQEQPLIERYDLPPAPRILDAGCGTGEAASRLAELFPRSSVLGVDIVDSSLDLARARFANLAPRLSFEHRSVFGLELPRQSFDLTVCRHVLQSIPFPDLVIEGLVNVTRPGGYLHLIAEDYGMIHSEKTEPDSQKFWNVVTDSFSASTKTDLHIGRHVFGMLARLSLQDIKVHYLVVDTLRVPRDTLVAIFESWRDGYVDPIGDMTPLSRESALAHFNQMIAQLRDPMRYAVWLVPVVSARVPVSASVR
jgi:ubiquinone/menaquinone biosynthesis C-methylase UbiE